MRIVFISADSTGRVHAREWDTGKNQSKIPVDLHNEFNNAAQHYRANGHHIEVDEWTGEVDESLLYAIKVPKQGWEFLPIGEQGGAS